MRVPELPSKCNDPGCAAPQICLKTEGSQYVAARPAAGYKKLYGHLTEQADIAFEVGPAALGAHAKP